MLVSGQAERDSNYIGQWCALWEAFRSHAKLVASHYIVSLPVENIQEAYFKHSHLAQYQYPNYWHSIAPLNVVYRTPPQAFRSHFPNQGVDTPTYGAILRAETTL